MFHDPSRFRSKPTIKEAIKNQNDVGLIVSNHLFSTKAKHSNSVFSPASINAALTLAASGPRGSSISAGILSFLRSSSIDELNAVFSEIVSVVFADRSANGGPKMSSVNGVWIEQSLPIDSSSFKLLFENVFKASFDLVDFRSKAEEVRVELNTWAFNHTNGLIKDLLPPGLITDLTEIVYGNALYFKGEWEVPFNKSYTKDGEFHLLNGTSVSVPFMRSYKKQYIQAFDGFKVLRIPYRQGGDDTKRQVGDVTNRSFPFGQGGGGDVTNRSFPFGQSGGGDVTKRSSFSMYFYLPDKKDGLDDLVKTMASTSGFLDSHVPNFQVLVNEFRIPKFKIDYTVNGPELGFHSLPLVHKACVEIDEVGAEAAAATFTVAFGSCSAYVEPPRIDFVADHPFLFFIREDKTGTVLFVGQIFDPSIKSS